MRRVIIFSAINLLSIKKMLIIIYFRSTVNHEKNKKYLEINGLIFNFTSLWAMAKLFQVVDGS